ncbi:hypothetical protein HANVADRAFT_2466 [Hanseniaspora valbyensis NRRL Y-1626]|uniref:Uncharacterized protein n=1 Tax=Hanseniaspora valbyensis NRRL Y-1626 TaxID=766949 RepID=A0A1B7TDT3_9ASCO|nr:hypothetical protein HANVADRAFT_2466 [Hanseniaspora valbyensis NRRL Y-1626]
MPMKNGKKMFLNNTISKYVKIVDKMSGGHNIKLNGSHDSTTQYIVFLKGLNSYESMNLILGLIESRPFCKILNIDHDYNTYIQNKNDEKYNAKFQEILQNLNKRYWHFNLPDFNNNLISEGKKEILDDYSNNTVVELVNFIKLSKETSSKEIYKETTPILFILDNFPQDLTENSNKHNGNDNKILKINSTEFIKSNYKNISLIIKILKYFLYLNNKILKLDLYLIQLGTIDNLRSISINPFNFLVKGWKSFKNQEQQIKINAKIDSRKWLYEQQSASLQQFWESLLLENSLENNKIKTNFLSVRMAPTIYTVEDRVTIPMRSGNGVLITMTIPVPPPDPSIPMNYVEKRITQRIIKRLSIGIHGEQFEYGFYDKIDRVMSKYWRQTIHDSL